MPEYMNGALGKLFISSNGSFVEAETIQNPLLKEHDGDVFIEKLPWTEECTFTINRATLSNEFTDWLEKQRKSYKRTLRYKKRFKERIRRAKLKGKQRMGISFKYAERLGTLWKMGN